MDADAGVDVDDAIVVLGGLLMGGDRWVIPLFCCLRRLVDCHLTTEGYRHRYRQRRWRSSYSHRQ